jgi:hypothetical protein
VCVHGTSHCPTVPRLLLKHDFVEYGFASAINYKQTSNGKSSPYIPQTHIGERTYYFPSFFDGGEKKLQVPAVLHPGKGLRYPLDRKQGGPHSRSGRFGGEKGLMPLLGTEARYTFVHRVKRSLYRQSYPHPCRIVFNLFFRKNKLVSTAPGTFNLMMEAKAPSEMSFIFSIPQTILSV